MNLGIGAGDFFGHTWIERDKDGLNLKFKSAIPALTKTVIGSSEYL